MQNNHTDKLGSLLEKLKIYQSCYKGMEIPEETSLKQGNFNEEQTIKSLERVLDWIRNDCIIRVYGSLIKRYKINLNLQLIKIDKNQISCVFENDMNNVLNCAEGDLLDELIANQKKCIEKLEKVFPNKTVETYCMCKENYYKEMGVFYQKENDKVTGEKSKLCNFLENNYGCVNMLGLACFIPKNKQDKIEAFKKCTKEKYNSEISLFTKEMDLKFEKSFEQGLRNNNNLGQEPRQLNLQIDYFDDNRNPKNCKFDIDKCLKKHNDFIAKKNNFDKNTTENLNKLANYELQLELQTAWVNLWNKSLVDIQLNIDNKTKSLNESTKDNQNKLNALDKAIESCKKSIANIITKAFLTNSQDLQNKDVISNQNQINNMNNIYVDNQNPGRDIFRMPDMLNMFNQFNMLLNMNNMNNMNNFNMAFNMANQAYRSDAYNMRDVCTDSCTQNYSINNMFNQINNQSQANMNMANQNQINNSNMFDQINNNVLNQINNQSQVNMNMANQNQINNINNNDMFNQINNNMFGQINQSQVNMNMANQSQNQNTNNCTFNMIEDYVQIPNEKGEINNINEKAGNGRGSIYDKMNKAKSKHENKPQSTNQHKRKKEDEEGYTEQAVFGDEI